MAMTKSVIGHTRGLPREGQNLLPQARGIGFSPRKIPVVEEEHIRE